MLWVSVRKKMKDYLKTLLLIGLMLTAHVAFTALCMHIASLWWDRPIMGFWFTFGMYLLIGVGLLKEV